MGHWRTFFSSKHLDSGDLATIPKAMLRLTSFGPCDETETDGAKKMLIGFEPGEAFKKAMLANSTAKPQKYKTTWIAPVTIGLCLEKMFDSSDPKDWIGKLIVVYSAKIRDGEAVRVWGSPHIDREMTVDVRDFGGKRKWKLVPVPMPGAKPQTAPQTDPGTGEIVPPATE